MFWFLSSKRDLVFRFLKILPKLPPIFGRQPAALPAFRQMTVPCIMLCRRDLIVNFKGTFLACFNDLAKRKAKGGVLPKRLPSADLTYALDIHRFSFPWQLSKLHVNMWQHAGLSFFAAPYAKTGFEPVSTMHATAPLTDAQTLPSYLDNSWPSVLMTENWCYSWQQQQKTTTLILAARLQRNSRTCRTSRQFRCYEQ